MDDGYEKVQAKYDYQAAESKYGEKTEKKGLRQSNVS